MKRKPKLNEIDSIDLYVRDIRQSTVFFTSQWGLQIVAEAGPETGMVGRRSVVLAQGEVRLVLISALEAEGPVAEYLQLHGDGVKDIAFSVDDAVGAFHDAVARGARPLLEPTVRGREGARVIRATVGGVGDMVHSFVQREGVPCVQDPLVYRLIAANSSPAPGAFSRIDHVAMCLETGTLDDTVAFYREVFGFVESHRDLVKTEYGGMDSKVVQNDSGAITFPMQEPIGGGARGQISDFLALHRGPGVQHVAFLTDDMVSALRGLRERGVELLPTPASYYDVLLARVGHIDEEPASLRELGILVDRDPWGYLMQIFTRSHHERGTLFFEVIQRKDARGFGRGNVRALFEALERESKGQVVA